MTSGVPIEHSRASRLAANLSGEDDGALEAHMDQTVTVISVERDLPGGLETARQLIDTLRRMPGQLILIRSDLPKSFVLDVLALSEAIDPARPLQLRDTPEEMNSDVHLHVGAKPMPGAIRLVPEGYGGHVIADGTVSGVTRRRSPNALGIVFTAALGAAEAFKTNARVRPGQRYSPAHLQFCPVSLGPDLSLAPDLPDAHHAHLGVIGVGAIGTAIVKIVSGLPIHGRILLVDRQPFEPENVGTYSLGTPADAATGIRKVALAARELRGFCVSEFDGPVDELPAAIEAGTQDWPPVLLCGLDENQPRHEAQRLWPDTLIDAATGNTVCGLHHVTPNSACVMCLLPIDRSGPSAEERLGEVTGLDPKVLGTDEALMEEDLIGASPEHLPRLRALLGTPKCALAQLFGISDLDPGEFRPSVPFVSQQAACLAVGRYIATVMGIPIEGNIVQYDALLGPRPDIALTLDPRPGCYCQERRAIIEQVRESYRQRRGGPP